MQALYSQGAGRHQKASAPKLSWEIHLRNVIEVLQVLTTDCALGDARKSHNAPRAATLYEIQSDNERGIVKC